MSSVAELANIPREIELGGKTLKIRQLKLREIFGYFEIKIKNKKIKEAKEMASVLDSQERNTFLIEAWKNLPTGSELTEMCSDTMTSVDGVVDLLYLASKDHNDINKEAISHLIDLNDLDQLAPIVTWITGVSGEEISEEDKKKVAIK